MVLECYAICEKENNVAIGAVELKLNGHTDKTGKQVFSLEEAKKKLPSASKIIYMGSIHASHIQEYKNAAKHFSIQCACGVGLCDTGTLTSEVRKATAIPDSIPVFTIQGGMNRSKLKGMDKMLIGI